MSGKAALSNILSAIVLSKKAFRLSRACPLVVVPGRILVIPLRFIGDTVLSVPLLRALRQAFPEARLEVWVTTATQPLLSGCPYVDACVVEPRDWPGRLQAIRGAEVAFLLRKSVSMAVALKLARVGTVVGYDSQRWPWGFCRWGLGVDVQRPYPDETMPERTQIQKNPDNHYRLHQATHHLGLLRAYGAQKLGRDAMFPEAQPPMLELWPQAQDTAWAQASLKQPGNAENRPWAALHLSSTNPRKCLPQEAYVALLRHGQQQGWQWLGIGATQADRLALAALAEQAGVPLRNMAAETTLSQTVALLCGVSCLVSIDSGPLHLAAAVGVSRILGIYRGNAPQQWGALPAMGYDAPRFTAVCLPVSHLPPLDTVSGLLVEAFLSVSPCIS
jgi:ADP-heptose:LPS heptosyltransferase